MPRNSSRGRNNNPTGRNQYSNEWLDAARDRPIAVAATAAAAVGAGVFLWSKRNQISEQISNLSNQISDWRSADEGEFETVGATSSGATGSTSARTSRSTGSRPTSTRSRSSRTSRGMSATGGSSGPESI